MAINTRNKITASPDARFFLAPESAHHRQYEALRAFFVEQLPGPQAARRFGYSPNAFRVLCYQFRHDPGKRTGFFQHPKPGPHHAPARDRVRELAVALRKQNLSIYDIQRELARPAMPSASMLWRCSCAKRASLACPAAGTTNGP